MNCLETREYLEEYMQGETDAAVTADIKSHLEACPECRKQYEALCKTRDKIKQAYGDITVPESLSRLGVNGQKGAKAVKTGFFVWSGLKKSTRRSMIAVACIITLLAGILIPANIFFPGTVQAEEFRNGYSLEPDSSDATGVLTGSAFTFKSQRDINLKELKEKLSIDEEPAPAIENAGFNTFRVTPGRELANNRLYTFRIKEGGEDITWTFQTAAPFRVVSVFPADKVVNVPVNTGIELYFSHDGYEDIGKYFEITPAVKGSFERHKKAVVFVPEELKPGTLYTVKVRQGLRLKGTEYTLKEDYTFSFETGGGEGGPYTKGHFSFSRVMYEYATGEKPFIPVNYWVNSDRVKEASVAVKTKVYSYRSIEAFTGALDDRLSVPMWASYNYGRHYVPVEGLEKVLEFESKLPKNSGSDPLLTLPQVMEPGYYLVDSSWDDIRSQCFLQVTDIGAYVTETGNGSLFWLNDLKTGKPLSGAEVTLKGATRAYKADKDGLVNFNSSGKAPEADMESKPWYIITAPDGRKAVISRAFSNYGYYGSDGMAGLYWNVLQTDRSLYKPDDEVFLWGMLKNRYSDEKVSTVTVEINSGYRYYDYASFRGAKSKSIWTGHYSPVYDQPLLTERFPVTEGVYKGKLKLPNLAPGGYNLTVSKDGETISSSYLSVEDYVKPAYQLSVNKEKEAVFLGQAINIELQAAFFEGTGAPGLDVRYGIYNDIGGGSFSGRGKTDAGGKVRFSYKPEASSKAQGAGRATISCSAVLPESGEISESSDLRVFVNDINADISSGDGKGNKGIAARVNRIDPKRLNNGTAKDEGDFLGAPVANKVLNGTIYKNTYVRIADGTYYDFINKVTQKRYRYETRKTVFKSFSMTTGSDGRAFFPFDEKADDDSWFSAEITTVDGNGRTMRYDHYLNDYAGIVYYYNENRYWLDDGKAAHSLGEKVSYKLDEKVKLTYKKGMKPLESGRFLYLKNQNGLRGYELSDKSDYSFTVGRKDIPNAYVTGIYFNGKTYVQSELYNVVYDYADERLTLEAEAEKDAYRPGEEAVIRVTARDRQGRPKNAVVNIILVDEALLKLSGQEQQTLELLYRLVSPGIEFSYITHSNNSNPYVTRVVSGREGMVDAGFQFKKSMNYKQKLEFAFAEDVKIDETSAGSVRSSFKDTAHFATIALDNNGKGEFRFRLPDNVTSWRVMLSGVAADLKAGNGKASMKVSLPFFINTSLNTAYLAGDRPELGVNAYGSGLKEGQEVSFEVTSSSNPELRASAAGKVFERVVIPLWKLEEGTDDLIITAKAGSLKDSIKLPIKVYDTYLQQQKAEYYKLTPGLKIKGGEKGNTRLVFADKGRGRYLPELAGMLNTAGSRIDQRLAAAEAGRLLRKYFKQEAPEGDSSFKISDYQREDGGLALLPYGSSDADMTALLVTLVKDQADQARLRQYFYNLLNGGGSGIQGNALYGLGALREPVLLDLDKAANVNNAGIKDLIYLALAYCELGEAPKAEKLYNERIMKHIEESRPYFRIDTGADNDDMLDTSALAAILAAKLNKPEKDGLYEYCRTNAAKDVLLLIQRLLCMESELKDIPEDKASFSYEYEGVVKTKELAPGEVWTLSIPSEKLDEFKVASVKGAVSLTAMFNSRPETARRDNYLKLDRKYYNNEGERTTDFKASDIVKVVIDWDIAAKAIDGQYEVTDYAPSGLKPIDNPGLMGARAARDSIGYRSIDGQKVTFYVGKGWERKYLLTYYARVVTPGTFKAEAPVIQSVEAQQRLNTGKETIITIK